MNVSESYFRMFGCLFFLMLLHRGESTVKCNYDGSQDPWNFCIRDCSKTDTLNFKQYRVFGCTNDTLYANTDTYAYEEFEFVEFIDSNITTIKNFAFDGLSILYLTLSDSFRTVEPKSFSGINKIWGIYFINNKQLTTLPKELLRNLTSLFNFGIINNGPTHIHGDTFVGLTLQKLYIFGNKIACFPFNFFPKMTSKGPRQIVLSFPTNTTIETINSQIHFSRVKEKRENDEYQGLCAKSFSNSRGRIEYDFEVDKCVQECGPSVKDLKVIPSDKECDCDSMEGCMDHNCKAVSPDGVTLKPDMSNGGNAIPKTTPLLCLAIGVSLGVIGLVRLV